MLTAGRGVFGASRKKTASGQAVQRQARIPRYHDDTILWRFFHLIGVHAPQELKTTFTLDLQPTEVINQIVRDDSENLLVFPTVVAQTRRSTRRKTTAQSFFFRWRLQLTSRISRVNQSPADAQSRIARERGGKNTKFQEFSGERELLRRKWSENSGEQGKSAAATALFTLEAGHNTLPWRFIKRVCLGNKHETEKKTYKHRGIAFRGHKNTP